MWSDDAAFTYRDRRGSVLVDPVTCLLAPPGGTVEMGHPAPGGDVDTFVYLSPETWHMIVPDSVVPLTADVTGHMQVTHRRLLVAAHDSEPMLIEELVVYAACRRGLPVATPAGVFGTAGNRRGAAPPCRGRAYAPQFGSDRVQRRRSGSTHRHVTPSPQPGLPRRDRHDAERLPDRPSPAPRDGDAERLRARSANRADRRRDRLRRSGASGPGLPPLRRHDANRSPE